MPSAAEIKRQIAQLDELTRSGVLSGDASRQARQRLEQSLATEVAAGRGDADAAPSRSTVGAAAARPSPNLVGGIAIFVLVVSVGLYAWLGNFAAMSVAPGSTPPQAAADGAHELGNAQIESMIGRLAERLKTAPDDAEGWSMLGRSYSALGRHPDAVPAFRRVVELRPQDAAGYADLADAVATTNGRKLDGEPEQLINKALQLDPNNVKALSLSGTVSFRRGDPLAAARQWERALKQVDPASDLARQLQGALDDARQRAGVAPSPAGGGTTQAVAQGSAGAALGATIRGRVSLSPKLKGQVSPEDTVFIYARATEAGRPPLAILRKQVRDLPFDFTLDDSLAMNPAMRLSTVAQVNVGARVSKSGTAMAQPGDLQGQVGPVAVGANAVLIEIADTVR